MYLFFWVSKLVMSLCITISKSEVLLAVWQLQRDPFWLPLLHKVDLLFTRLL
jgi:hypothetical protein